MINDNRGRSFARNKKNKNISKRISPKKFMAKKRKIAKINKNNTHYQHMYNSIFTFN